jgi:hypothetical protein
MTAPLRGGANVADYTPDRRRIAKVIVVEDIRDKVESTMRFEEIDFK